MVVVLDLDDTLLKTSSVIKRALAASCADLGLSSRQFLSAYRAMRIQGPFDLKRFQQYLPPSLQGQWPAIRSRLVASLRSATTKELLYADARQLLQWLGAHNIPTCVYTHGSASIQAPKVRALQKRFPYLHIVITGDYTKQKDLRRCFSRKLKNKFQDPWIWVDDSVHVARTSKKFPHCHFFYLGRRKSSATTAVRGVTPIRSLSQVRRYLESLPGKNS
ncbi:HAD family hydrolase [Candidatus Uhrbacteria bacterium]|nr:HAD family hydrolase [Candidatus Uhrbacteria bacterium]